MAKRTNIVRIIKNEIEKGNTIITANGNFVSPSLVENGIKEEFIKELRAGTVEVTTSFDQYKEKELGKLVKADDVLAKLKEVFELDGEPVAKDSETHSEQCTEIPSEPVPNEPKPKKTPKKDVK